MGVLDDKVAIVTGSARGLGRATAELLSELDVRPVGRVTDILAAALEPEVTQAASPAA